jgi:hypothetical protein
MSARRTQARRPTTAILEPEAYNPLSEKSLSASLRRKIEEQPLAPFPPPTFRGAELYALYYELYSKLCYPRRSRLWRSI